MYNANNYGYGNYYGQPRYQPMENQMQQVNSTVQPMFNSIQSRSLLNGKQVESIDVVKSMDIPLDGSISYFPIADGSAIVTKQLQMDGRSETVIYKKIENEKELPKYITTEDLNKAIKEIDLSDIEDLKEDLKDIKSEIKDLKKKKKDD